jgi:AcrR family transcriptional regulator
MAPASAVQPAAHARRPSRQRHEQILSTAARLFAERGFSGVGIDDIGAELGVSGPALYRHIIGKDAVLAEIVVSLVDEVAAVSRAALAAAVPEPPDPLLRLLAAAVDLCLCRQAEVTVTLRSVWHIQSELRVEVRRHWAEVVGLWAGPLMDAHHGLDPEDQGLYLRASAGLVIANARVPSPIPRARLVELGTVMISAMLATELTHVGSQSCGAGRATVGLGWTRSSRREQILDAAIALFRDHGYRGVSMRDIGAAVGTSASAAYRHFDSKEDILATAITRVSQRVTAGLSDALSEAAAADDALDRLLRSYISICVQSHELMAVATSEAHHLSPHLLHALRDNQRLFTQEWTHCLASARPGLTAGEVQVLVRAVVGLVTEATRSRRLERRAHLEEHLFRLARAAIYAG